MSDRPGSSVEQELWQLTRQVRAAVEWLADSGVEDLPRSNPEEQLLQLFSLDPPRNRRRKPPAMAMPTASATNQAITAAAAPPSPPVEPAPAASTTFASTTTAQKPVVKANRVGTASSDQRRDQVAPMVRLRQLEAEVSTCTQCSLHEARTKTVFARGNPSADLMFIGEGPGFNEDQQGLPFVGKAGQLLDKMITAMGFSPKDVYIANVVKCRPPDNRKPKEEEIASCVGYLREQIELVQPKMLVALGATGIQGLLGTRVGITRLRGQWKLYDGRIPIMPTFHPAYLLRQPEKKRDVWNDLKQVMQKLGTLPKVRS